MNLLLGRTIQILNTVVDNISVDTGSPVCKFTLTGFRFRRVNNYMDWSTFSGDTTHLPLHSKFMRERMSTIPFALLVISIRLHRLTIDYIKRIIKLLDKIVCYEENIIPEAELDVSSI